MRQKSEKRAMPEQIVKDICRAPRKHNSAEQKFRVALDGLRGQHSIAVTSRIWYELRGEFCAAVTEKAKYL